MSSFLPTESLSVIGAMNLDRPMKQNKMPKMLTQNWAKELNMLAKTEDEVAFAHPPGEDEASMIEACLRELQLATGPKAPPAPAGYTAPSGVDAPPGLALPVSHLANRPVVRLPKKGVSGSDNIIESDAESTSLGPGSMKSETESEADEGFQMKATAPCFVPDQMNANASHLVPGLQRTPLRSLPCTPSDTLQYVGYSSTPYDPSPPNEASALNVEVNKNPKGEVVHIRVSKKAKPSEGLGHEMPALVCQ